MAQREDCLGEIANNQINQTFPLKWHHHTLCMCLEGGANCNDVVLYYIQSGYHGIKYYHIVSEWSHNRSCPFTPTCQANFYCVALFRVPLGTYQLLQLLS